MIKTVIVDDEPHATKSLEILLAESCPQIQVLASFNNPVQALSYLQANQVDLVFLDIEMPFINGFELLKRLVSIHFDVIFVTAYDQYAIRAFKFSAFDYLLKPIDEIDLVNSVKQYESKKSKNNQSAYIEHLIETFKTVNTNIKRIALPTFEGYEFIETDTIIRCESDSNYTKFYLKNRPVIMVSRTLKEIEETLIGMSFLRVHNSHIIAKNHILKYIKADGSYILMSDNAQIPISRTRKEEVLSQLTK